MRRLRARFRRVALATLVGFLLALPLGYAFLEYTTRPRFCGTCHIMEPYVASWESSSHRDVPCVDCHYEPGLLETAKGKFKALSQLAKYVTGTEGTKPWAEVSDASCMRGGCHSTRLLAGDVRFDAGPGAIAFDHAPHLLEMRRSKRLRCTSCHSQIVQGEHVSVTPSTCFLCHFKEVEEDPKLSDCPTCHGPPTKPIDLGGFVFEHRDYLARGVGCVSCHEGITRGTGEVPRQRCGSCHAVVEHLERFGETEFLHRKHVTEHKVDCLECHAGILHRLAPRERPSEGGCGACHAKPHGAAEAFYRGEGGRGVGPTPSAMYLARVACTGCHVHPPGIDATSAAPPRAREFSCLSCHGVGYEGMTGRWQRAFEGALGAVEREISEATARAANPGVEADEHLRRSLEDARHDVALVRSDGSRGVHNPWFARRLLESSHARGVDIWLRLDPDRPRPPLPLGPKFPTNLECASLCHLGIEEEVISLAGTRFDHAAHLGRAGHDCDACHSTAEHGRTLVGPGDCVRCHHGPEARIERDCVSCHEEVDRFLRGVGPTGEAGAQVMGEVPCAECHGDASRGPALEVVRKNCVRCHDEGEAEVLDFWVEEAREWFAEAESRLAPLRESARAKGAEALRNLGLAETILARVRRAGPSHNPLAFSDEKDRFEAAAAACEKGLRDSP